MTPKSTARFLAEGSMLVRSICRTTQCPCQVPSEDLSLARVYALARRARSKLCAEADKMEHNLRRMVAHANLLDELLEELTISGNDNVAKEVEAEIRHTPKKQATPSVLWADTTLDELDEDQNSDVEAGSGSDTSEDDEDAVSGAPLCRVSSRSSFLIGAGINPLQAAAVGQTIARVSETVAKLAMLTVQHVSSAQPVVGTTMVTKSGAVADSFGSATSGSFAEDIVAV